ncbi:MAG: hypothetical protein JSS27_06190 [Planctomycetes bacterium]|nr:hypothetical protein [Planctomycetota bacterium]
MCRLALLILILGAVAAAPAGVGRVAGPPERRDRHGDRLPESAVTRIGTVRYRGLMSRGPDPKTLAVLRENRVVVVDAETCAEVRRLPGPDPARLEVDSFLLDPAGRRVAYGGGNRIAVLDVATGQTVFEGQFERESYRGGLEFSARPVAFVPGSDVLIAECPMCEMPIVAWHLGRRQRAWQFGPIDIGNDDTTTHVLGLIAGNSQLVVVRSRSTETVALMLDAATGEERASLELGANLDFNHAVLSPDGKQMAFSDNVLGIHRVELPGGGELERIKVQGESDTYGMQYSRDSRRLVVLGPYWMQMFDATTAKSLGRNNASGFIGINNPRLVFSEDDSTLWVQGTDDSRWRKFDGRTAREKKLPDLGPQGHVTCLAVSADGSRVITGCNDDLPRVYNGMTGEQLRRYSASLFGAFTGRDDSGVGGVAITADGSLAALRMNDDRVVIWEPSTGRSRRTINLDGAFAGDTVAFSPDGKTLAVGPGGFAGPNRAKVENPLRQFDVATGREKPAITKLTGQVSSLVYSPCGRWLGAVTMHQDDSPGYLLIEASTGRLLRSISANVYTAAFVPFADAIVYSSPEELVMWEPASGEVRVRYPLPHDDMIDLLAVSPCGRWLAGANNGSGTRKIYLWDLRTGHVLPPLYGHNHYISSLAFGPNGRLVSGSFDTTALVWDVNTRPCSAPAALPKEQWSNAWSDLAGNGITAHNTTERLIATGSDVVPFLRERVRPATAVDPALVTELIGRLDAPKFTDRQRATLELERFDRIVEPALRLAMQELPSAEARRRVQRLLDRMDGPHTDPDRAREMRAVEALARMNEPDAVALLKELAGGVPAARLTQAARRACERR